MKELYQFVKKSTTHLQDVTYRVSFGLDAVFISNKAFILISENEQIVIRIENLNFLTKIRASHDMPILILNGKEMEHWYLIPRSFNKKKNKLIPFINSAHTALFDKRKIKKKVKKTNEKYKAPRVSFDRDIISDNKKINLIDKIRGWF
mgnify:CR=1 FL=1